MPSGAITTTPDAPTPPSPDPLTDVSVPPGGGGADLGEPICTVVVPAFNREATLTRTIGSVLRSANALRGRRVEVIVVDDGSVDGTAIVARSLAAGDDRVWDVHIPNSGVSAARNAGLRLARGAYVMFVDCDDEVEPAWLPWFVEQLDAGYDLAFCAGRALRHGHPASVREPEPLGPAFAAVTGVFLPGLFALRRDLFGTVGGYAVPLRYSENTELGLRVCSALEARGPVQAVATSDVLMTIHLPARGGSNAYSSIARYESALYLADVHAPRLARDPHLLAGYWAIAGVAAARLGRPRDAFRSFCRAVRTEPTNGRHVLRAAAVPVPLLRRRLWPPDRT